MGRVLGIIGEYNPFHNGHLYHMMQSIEQTGANYTVCVITGNFVQRGNTSIVDKSRNGIKGRGRFSFRASNCL